MADYKAPLRDMRFVLHEVFQAPSLWARLPALAETGAWISGLIGRPNGARAGRALAAQT